MQLFLSIQKEIKAPSRHSILQLNLETFSVSSQNVLSLSVPSKVCNPDGHDFTVKIFGTTFLLFIYILHHQFSGTILRFRHDFYDPSMKKIMAHGS